MKRELLAFVFGIGVHNFSHAQIEQKEIVNKEYSEPINIENPTEYNKMIPNDVFDLFTGIIPEIIEDPKADVRSFSKIKLKNIPKSYFLKEGEFVKGINKENLNILFFKPTEFFYSKPEDIQVWSIINNQLSFLTLSKKLRSGFYNLNGKAIFFSDFIYESKNKLKHSMICICVHKDMIIEVVYNYPTSISIEANLP